MPRKHYGHMSIDQAIAVIDQWIASGRRFDWDAESVKRILSEHAVNGRILFRDASGVLRGAAMSKMIQSSVGGMGWISDEWRRLSLQRPEKATADAKGFFIDHPSPASPVLQGGVRAWR